MNWKSIIATAIITGVVTIASGMLLFRWQTAEPKLIYNSIRSIPFDDVSNKLFIQQIEVENLGNKPAEEVVLIISFTNEIIQKFQVNIDKAISYKESSDDKAIKLWIDNLNTGEGVNVSVLYQSPNPQSTGAIISLRANGVTGKSIGATQKESQEPIWIAIALFAAYAGIFSFFLSSKERRAVFSKTYRNLFSGFFIGLKNLIVSELITYGYPEKAKEYLQLSKDIDGWQTVDFLVAEAINGEEKLKKDIIKILNDIIETQPFISSISKTVIYYNIARLFKNLGEDNEKVVEYLELAKKLNKWVIERRISCDPLFLSLLKSE